MADVELKRSHCGRRSSSAAHVGRHLIPLEHSVPEPGLAVAVLRTLRPSLGVAVPLPFTLPAAPAGATPPLQACARHVSLRVSLPGPQDCFAPSGRLVGTCGLINHHTRKGHETK